MVTFQGIKGLRAKEPVTASATKYRERSASVCQGTVNRFATNEAFGLGRRPSEIFIPDSSTCQYRSSCESNDASVLLPKPTGPAGQECLSKLTIALKSTHEASVLPLA